MTQSQLPTFLARAHEGMELAAAAAQFPDRTAVFSASGELSFAQLNTQANRLARVLQAHDIGPGDAIALLCRNRPEFCAVRFAAHRSGVRITPINWHLNAAEVQYIVDNCDAVALFADVSAGAAAEQAVAGNKQLRLQVAIGGELPGFQRFAELADEGDGSDIAAPVLGNTMLYTSGTTGRPKGVLRKQPDPQLAATMLELMLGFFQYDPDGGTDLALCTGPLYHAGPFNICMTQPLSAGIGIVLMDDWTAQQTLQLIEQHRISHVFFVPTMFNRLLDLPDRQQFDVSSLKFVIHGAAPCPVPVKQQMLDWFGPIIWEMFAGTEGPGTIVSPQDWLAKPGTVGRPGPEQVRILSDAGEPVPAGHTGNVFLENPAGSAFEYYNDPEKTRSVLHQGYYTAGDIGYLDADGYLFLTGRSAEVIIAGGVNLYPQEIDDVLVQHPDVADVACVGVPNAEWGEEVKAIVQCRPGVVADDALAEAILTYAQAQLPKQKWPRSVEFIEQLPRSAAGKVQRNQLREAYWHVA